jgi:Type IV pilin-like G and H, putative
LSSAAEMSYPPEPDRKLLTKYSLITFIALGIILSPVLFVLQQFFVFITYTPPSVRESWLNKPKYHIALLNRVQILSIAENGRFARSFDELEKIGGLEVNTTATSRGFEYKLNIRSKDLAIIGAKPSQEAYGFSGATFRSTNAKGLVTTSSVVCKSKNTGTDGTDLANAPIPNSAGKLICPIGWTIVDKTHNEQLDRKNGQPTTGSRG